MINAKGGNIKIFACNSNRPLAEAVAKKLGVSLGEAEIGQYSDGETAVKIVETIRGADVYIIQSTSAPVNDNLMELLIVIDAMKRASAARINAVIPYFGYARQDRKTRARDPISAKLVANMIECAGADRVLTMDLHCTQIQGFFDIPVDNLVGSPILSEYYIKKHGDDLKNFVVVSPDLGSVSRARAFAERLDTPLAIIDKRRPSANVSEIMNIIGDVKGKKVILIDDMIDTAGTIANAATALMERGAIEVDACCTHGILSGPAIERIQSSPITELLVLDSVLLPAEKMLDKITIVSIADFLAEGIKCIHEGKSISWLFS